MVVPVLLSTSKGIVVGNALSKVAKRMCISAPNA